MKCDDIPLNVHSYDLESYKSAKNISALYAIIARFLAVGCLFYFAWKVGVSLMSSEPIQPEDVLQWIPHRS